MSTYHVWDSTWSSRCEIIAESSWAAATEYVEYLAPCDYWTSGEAVIGSREEIIVEDERYNLITFHGVWDANGMTLENPA